MPRRPTHNPAAARTPRQLKGYKKVRLKPGRARRVTFHLNQRSFAYWDGGWKVAPGCSRVYLGKSSRKLPLRGRICR